MKKNRYFAVESSPDHLLEPQLYVRLHLALLAEQMDIPFVYTAIKNNMGVCRSEHSLDTLNLKWASFFRALVDEFEYVEDVKEGFILLNDKGRVPDMLFNVDPMFRTSLAISDWAKQRIKDFYGPHAFLKTRGVIKKAALQKSIKKYHRAYIETFSPGARTWLEDNTLKAVFVLTNDNLQMPFVLRKLISLLDFCEECARCIESDLEVHLFVSLGIEEVLSPSLQEEKEERLAEACRRPYVNLHENPSFEKLTGELIFADLVFTVETHYDQYIFKSLVALLSAPRQINLELKGGAGSLFLNSSFLSWSGENLICGRKEAMALLRAAKRGEEFQEKEAVSFKKYVRRLSRIKKNKDIKIASCAIDGIGSYYIKSFTMQAIADYYGWKYVHVSPPCFEHIEYSYTEKIKKFFMLGMGYPSFEEVFDNCAVDARYSRLLPPLAYLRALECTPDTLILSKMAGFQQWPVPKSFLRNKILRNQGEFSEKHQDYVDCFDSKVLNIAVHIRFLDSFLPPALLEPYMRFRGIKSQLGLDRYLDLIGQIGTSMRQLQLPFKIHIYSNSSLQTLRPLIDVEDIQFHLAEEELDPCRHCLEMSRADLFFPAPSYISMLAVLLSKPSQIIFPQNELMRVGEFFYIFSLFDRVAYTEEGDILKDMKRLERIFRGKGVNLF